MDGFFINWAGFNERDYFRVYHGVCHCKNCQDRWLEYAGDIKLPDGPWSEGYADWKIFSDKIIDEWTARVRDFIAERLPEAGLILGSAADIMFHEANNAIDREIWHHATLETVSRFKSYRPDVPVLVNAASFLDHAYRITAEDAHQFAQYHLQAIARGANPSTYIIGVPGKIPWPGMKMASELMNFHAKWKNIYAGLKPVAKTALVLPHSSQRNASSFASSLSEYQGLYKSLQELHIPFDVIGQQDISKIANNSGLERYNIIILPDLGLLKSGDATVLDDWVGSGGSLIATGEVGTNGDQALQLKSLPASRRLELITDSEELWSTYFAPEQNRTSEHYYKGPLIPILGTYSMYEWRNNSFGRYKKLGYAPFAPPEYIYGNQQVDERGVGIGTFKHGTGLLVPFPLGRGYRELGLGIFRDFFDLVISEIDIKMKERITFDIAPQVEITLMSSNQYLVIHLINLSGIRRQNFGQHLPVPGGSVKIRGESHDIKARSLRGNITLEVIDGEIKLPGLDLYDVVVIEGLK